LEPEDEVRISNTQFGWGHAPEVNSYAQKGAMQERKPRKGLLVAGLTGESQTKQEKYTHRKQTEICESRNI
jgi:type IV secretory pathway VirD2 relaxase